MDIGKSTKTYQVDDQSWLGSAHGTDSTGTITLDVSAFVEATHYPNGYIPSGITLGRITASNLYGPYDNVAVDGREVMDGHLFAAVEIRTGNDVGAALLHHGEVVEARLPTNHGLNAAGKADVAGRIRYRAN